MSINVKEIRERTKRLLQHFRRSVGLSWCASPALFCARIGYEVISVAIPIVSLYLSQNVIHILDDSDYTLSQT